MRVKFDIKNLVDELGTQQKFAELTGIHVNQIGKFYNGVKMISLKNLAKIMEATGKEPNDLFVIETE